MKISLVYMFFIRHFCCDQLQNSQYIETDGYFKMILLIKLLNKMYTLS